MSYKNLKFKQDRFTCWFSQKFFDIHSWIDDNHYYGAPGLGVCKDCDKCFLYTEIK